MASIARKAKTILTKSSASAETSQAAQQEDGAVGERDDSGEASTPSEPEQDDHPAPEDPRPEESMQDSSQISSKEPPQATDSDSNVEQESLKFRRANPSAKPPVKILKQPGSLLQSNRENQRRQAGGTMMTTIRHWC